MQSSPKHQGSEGERQFIYFLSLLHMCGEPEVRRREKGKGGNSPSSMELSEHTLIYQLLVYMCHIWKQFMAPRTMTVVTSEIIEH